MKKIFTLLFALAVINTAKGQGHFDVGSNVINAAIGLGSSWGGYGGTQSPALSVSYEHGLWEAGSEGVISLGGYVGIKSFKYEQTGYNYLTSGTGYYTYVEKWNYTVIGARAAYHWNGIGTDKFDLYGGLMLSYNILSYTNNDPYFDTYGFHVDYPSYVGFSAFVGGRYYFSENIAVLMELGYGVAYLNIGASFKF